MIEALEPDVETLAREIGAYVATRPSAADTVERIARWWLCGSLKPSLARVQAALDLLVSRGLVARFPLPDGRFVYQRAPTSDVINVADSHSSY